MRGRFTNIATAKAVVGAFRKGREEYEQLELERASRGVYELHEENTALCALGCAALAAIVGEPEASEERAAARDAGAIKHVIKPCISDAHMRLHEAVCEECVAALHAMAVRLSPAQTPIDYLDLDLVGVVTGHALAESEGKEFLEQMFQLQVVRDLVMVMVS
eukprot:COSAG02_NODE_20712_length_818_cov_0.977747_2_plen_161_part_01